MPHSEQAIVRNFADIELKPLEWLWANRIPSGKLCTIAGTQGIELLTTVENLDRQGVLLEPGGSIGNVLAHYERKEPTQALRAAERGATQDTPKRFLGLLLSWSGRLPSGYLRICVWMRPLATRAGSSIQILFCTSG